MESWLLTDMQQGIWHDTFTLGPEDISLDTDANWSIGKRCLRGGLRDGVDIIWVNNGRFSFGVLPTRGMGIWRGKCNDLPVGWNSPVHGPVHPDRINLMERGGLGWLYGFDEMIVRCGLDWTGGPGKDAETPHTLHGRIANLPAHHVEVQVIPGDPAELVIIGEVDEAALFLPQLRLRTRISTFLNSCAFTIVDEVSNLRSVESDLELLYHCNFGPPFLDQGAELLIPTAMVAPRDPHAGEEIESYERYDAPTPGYAERCYWFEPVGDKQGNTLALLRNGAGDKAVAVRFNTAQLPCFTQWKSLGAESDGYVTGLEPGTDYPNPKPFERQQGRLKVLPPYGSYTASLSVEVCTDAAQVDQLVREVATLQRRAAMTRHAKPLATHTPMG